MLISLMVTWAFVAWRSAGHREIGAEKIEAGEHLQGDASPPVNQWQTVKGLFIAAIVVMLLIVSPLPREVVALTAAG
ncbi:MAG: hypothetical protein ACREUQ_06405, partial [Burkholderiales bacterium]